MFLLLAKSALLDINIFLPRASCTLLRLAYLLPAPASATIPVRIATYTPIKPWSQVASPRYVSSFLSRRGLSILTCQLLCSFLSSSFANSPSRAFRSSISASEKIPMSAGTHSGRLVVARGPTVPSGTPTKLNDCKLAKNSCFSHHGELSKEYKRLGTMTLCVCCLHIKPFYPTISVQ